MKNETTDMPDERKLCRKCITSIPRGYGRDDDLAALLQERIERRQEDLETTIEAQLRRSKTMHEVAAAMILERGRFLTITPDGGKHGEEE